MADIRIKDLATTASTTASDDFMAVDGTTNGTRKLSAATPSFATSVTVPGVSGPTATNLTLAGGSTGASLVLGQGSNGGATITTVGSGGTSLGTGATQPLKVGRNSDIIGYTSVSFNNSLSTNGLLGFSAWNGADTKLYIQHQGSGIEFRNAGATVAFLNGNGNLLIGTTTDISGTGGLKVAGTSTASSTTSGALQVGSNVGLSGNAGGASYFGGDLNVTRASTGLVSTQIYNSTSGTGAISGLEVRANNHTGLIYSLSDAFSSSGQYLAGGTILEARGSAGLMLSGYTSGPVKIWAANALRATIDGTGATFAGAVTVSGASGGLSNLITGNSSSGNYSFWDVNASPLASDGYSIFNLRAFSSLTGSKTQVFGIDVSKSGAGADNAAKVFFNLHNGTNFSPFMSVTAARDVSIPASTPSTNTTSGALVVTGGVGVGGALNAGASSTFTAGSYIDVSLIGRNGGAGSGGAQLYLTTTGAQNWLLGQRNDAAFSTANHLFLRDVTNSLTVLSFAPSTGAATFAGAVAIGNTVSTVSPTSPNRTVTMVIGGVTYYLAAKTTND